MLVPSPYEMHHIECLISAVSGNPVPTVCVLALINKITVELMKGLNLKTKRRTKIQICLHEQ